MPKHNTHLPRREARVDQKEGGASGEAMKSKKAPKRGRPLMIADLLREEAKIPLKHGGPFRNVRRALDGTSADNPKLRKILSEELTAFTATLFDKQQRRDEAGTENLKQKNSARRDEADNKARDAFEHWCAKLSKVLAGLTVAEKLRKYRKVTRLRQRDSRRLSALLKAGRL
jgi:hypothetical protein